MRLLKTLLLSAVAVFMIAGSASALVTVDATGSTVGPLAVGDTFTVDITLNHDGAGTLIGVFSSHVWDNTQLALLDAVFTPFPAAGESAPAIFSGQFEAGLGRFGTITGGIAGDDLSSSARTVQYASLDASSISGAAFITTLTFQVIGVGDGFAEVDGAFLAGESGADGDSFAFGTSAVVAIIPEPGTALLMGLGLMGLVGAGRRNA